MKLWNYSLNVWRFCITEMPVPSIRYIFVVNITPQCFPFKNHFYVFQASYRSYIYFISICHFCHIFRQFRQKVIIFVKKNVMKILLKLKSSGIKFLPLGVCSKQWFCVFDVVRFINLSNFQFVVFFLTKIKRSCNQPFVIFYLSLME